MNKALIKRIFRDYKLSIILYSTILILYVVMLVGFYPSIRDNSSDFEELLNAYPEGLADAFGITEASFSTFEGFMSVEFFSLMWILIPAFLIFSLAASFVAAEVDTGTGEFTYTLPISRKRLLLTQFLAGFGVILLVSLITFVSLLVGARLIDESFVFGNLAAFFGMSMSVFFFLLCVSTFLSTTLSSRGKAYGVTGGFFLVSYLLHVVHGLADNVDWLYSFSFLKYYGDPTTILIEGGVSISDVGVLLIVGLIFLIASIYQVERRDL